MAEQNKTWVDVQKKAFTRWANQFLSERRLKIENIETDLATGINLCNLLEIISSKSLGKYNHKPTMRYHYLENNGRAVKFIKDEGLQLVGIGPEDIVDGKLKLILGLIWTLILRYQINMIGEGSPKWELLQWVNRQIAPYNVDKPVVNFTTNWSDGKVLSALADSLQPGVLTPTCRPCPATPCRISRRPCRPRSTTTTSPGSSTPRTWSTAPTSCR
jgi:filamin